MCLCVKDVNFQRLISSFVGKSSIYVMHIMSAVFYWYVFFFGNSEREYSVCQWFIWKLVWTFFIHIDSMEFWMIYNNITDLDRFVRALLIFIFCCCCEMFIMLILLFKWLNSIYAECKWTGILSISKRINENCVTSTTVVRCCRSMCRIHKINSLNPAKYLHTLFAPKTKHTSINNNWSK